MKKTLYDKLWHDHLVKPLGDGFDLLYIDRHLVHEVTSPQAFEGLKLSNRKIWNVKSIVAVPDHNVPTTNRLNGIEDKISRTQVEALNDNCKTFGLMQFDLEDSRQGIVHVVGPEQGIVLPGMTVVCGDSHTSTHGALACLAFGIGTSEVEHVMATQCIIKKKAKNMLVNVEGSNSDFIFSKDIALHIIGQIGTAGGTGYAIEYKGNIALELRSKMGNRIFGCDDCQIFCPWNKFTQFTQEDDFLPRHNLDDVALSELFQWSEEEFLTKTVGSPIRRAGYESWLRNIAIALGNATPSEEVTEALRSKKDFPSEIVQEHVNWALLEQKRKLLNE